MKDQLRNLNPTPAAVFAMYHWHDRYAYEQKGGTMDFWDSLTREEKAFCNRAVLDIKARFKRF